MDWIPQIFRRRKFYEDLSEEIRLHIEERTEQLMSDGMSAEEATRARWNRSGPIYGLPRGSCAVLPGLRLPLFQRWLWPLARMALSLGY
jgi:hypothetical protein